MKYILLFSLLVLQSCTFAGKELPIDSTTYIVKKGDTLASISSKFGIASEEILALNKLRKPDRLWVGQDLLIPINVKKKVQPKETVKKAKKIYTDQRVKITSMHWPIAGRESGSGFGWRLFSFHEGIDIPAPRGTPIEAAHGGTVVYVGQKLRGYGKMVLVQAANVLTVYGHLNSYNVEIGDRVRTGDVLGFVGSSGDATGNHLHFETRIRDNEGKLVAVNPKDFFKQ